MLHFVLKSKDITWLTKVCIVKAMVFPVAIYGCESWTITKIEHQRIDAFKLWCWRRLLRVPWTARRSNQSVLKEINPEYSLEGLMLKLKFQYFGHWMWTADSWKRPWCWVRLKAEREEGNRGWDGWMASLTQWTWTWAAPGDSERQGSWLSMGLRRVGHNLATELQLCNWWSIQSPTPLPFQEVKGWDRKFQPYNQNVGSPGNQLHP